EPVPLRHERLNEQSRHANVHGGYRKAREFGRNVLFCAHRLRNRQSLGGSVVNRVGVDGEKWIAGRDRTTDQKGRDERGENDESDTGVDSAIAPRRSTA